MPSLRRPFGALRSVGIAATLVLVLAACGGDAEQSSDPPAASDASSEPTAPSSHGISDAPEPEDPCVTDAAGPDQASGAGFALTPPDGWTDASDQLTAALTGGDVSGIAWADQEGAEGGFADNFNVIVTENAGLEGIEELRDQFSAELRQAAQDVRPLDDLEIACEPALHQTAVTQHQGHDLVYDQAVAVRDETTYLITFTHTADTPPEARRAALTGVIESWRWVADD